MRCFLLLSLALTGCSGSPDKQSDKGEGECGGEACLEDCNTADDEDGDGLASCDDSDCDSVCDVDGDGFVGPSFGGDDCDDADPSINPEAAELCDGIDNNCNGLTDIDDPYIDDEIEWYPDGDGDGFGRDVEPQIQCDPPPGAVSNNTDCLDDDPDIHPDATEICDLRDNDCDALVDDDDPDVDLSTGGAWYADSDGDLLGDINVAVDACARPADHVPNADDCDDTDAALGFLIEWSVDGDGDGYGDGVSLGAASCAPPIGGAVPYDPVDCDDVDIAINPGAVELCEDGIDQNCDGVDDWCDPLSDTQLWQHEPRYLGTSFGDTLGWGMDNAGDFNGDGIDDLVIGAYGDGTVGNYAGAAFVFHGGMWTGVNPKGAADLTMLGEGPYDSAGISVAGLGDVNSDGFDDLLIGTWEGGAQAAPAAGKAYIVHGGQVGQINLANAATVITGTLQGGMAGLEVDGPGDVNGDGSPDALIAASTVGSVYLVHGPFAANISLANADATFQAEQAGDLLGTGVHSGDMDGDGLADLILGASGEGGASGAMYAVLGPQAGVVSMANAHTKYDDLVAVNNAGYGVAGGGDLNGDGIDDLAMDRYGDDQGGSDAGGAVVFYGPPPGGTIDAAQADVNLIGAQTGDMAMGVILPGDVDGDGTGDIVVGSYYAGIDGRAYLLLGPLAGSIDLSTADVFFDAGSYQALPARLHEVGDIDSDGYADFLLGAVLDSEGAQYGGAAYLILGAPVL